MATKNGLCCLCFRAVVICVCFISISTTLMADKTDTVNKTDWTKAEEKKLIELRKEGHLLIEIAPKLGKEYDSVKQKFDKLKNSNSLEIAAETDSYGVTLSQEERRKSYPNGVKFGFTIVDKEKNTSNEFIFIKSAGPDTVYNIRIWKKKAAIIGKRGNLDVVSIIYLDTHEVIDIIWAFKVKSSPSGRFISYVKFYSRTHHAPSDVVLVYDLDRSAAENRLVIRHHPKSDIGFPVYPKENVDKQSYDLTLSPERHKIMSRFLWSPDEKRLLFFDLHDSKNYLVFSDLSIGLNSPVIRSKYFDPKRIIKHSIAEKIKEQYESKIDSVSSYPVSMDLSWGSTENTLILRPTRHNSDWMVDEIIVWIADEDLIPFP